MKANSANGWRKVFGFTFLQFIKTKSFVVGTIIVSVIVILLVGGLNIIPKLAGVGDMITGETEAADIILSEMYLDDGSGLLTDEDTQTLQGMGIKQSQTDKTRQELIDELAQASSGRVLTVVDPQELEGMIVGYQVKVFYSPETDGASVDALAAAVSSMVSYRNMMELGVAPQDYAATQRTITSSKIEAGTDEWGVFQTMINYIVPLAASLILFILIFAYGQTVAQSIAIEKTSRVMELLLTSVRPLAVVIGKVLAMGLISLLQFLLILVVGGVTFAATAPFGIGGDVLKMLQDPAAQIGENAEIVEAINGSFGTISPLSVLLIFVIFILGFLFFSLIAALVGASVSRMEDLAQAMQPYSLLGVLGFYLAYFPVLFTMESLETGAASTNALQTFSYYFPVSSPFALPSALLLGKLSLGEVLVAILIQAAFAVIVAVIVARVYEMIILHNGSRLKFKDILKLAGKK